MRFIKLKDRSNAVVYINLDLVRRIEKWLSGGEFLGDGTVFFFGGSYTDPYERFISSETFESVTDRIAQTWGDLQT